MDEKERDKTESDTAEPATPWGSSDEHSETPGPHGTGEVYPRGERPEKDEPDQDDG